MDPKKVELIKNWHHFDSSQVFHRKHVSTQSFIAWPSSFDFHRTCFTARIRIAKCSKFEPMLVYFVKFYNREVFSFTLVN